MKKILLIDDEPEILKYMGKALVKNGYYVKTNSNSFEAMELLAKEEFDVLVTDIRMPDIDGIEILEIPTLKL